MSKILKYILIGIIVLIVIIFGIPMIIGIFSGFSSTVNPSGAFKQGQCVAECQKTNEEGSLLYKECTDKCIGPIEQ